MIDHNEFYLYLIRHGQSEVNVIPDHLGQPPETLLTEKGRNQAVLLGKRLAKEVPAPDYIHCSDYQRAADTCNIALMQNPKETFYPQFHEELREYSAGDWNGLVRSDVYTPETKVRMSYMGNAFRPPNGDSMHMVERRASRWLEDTVLYNTDMIERATDEGKKMNVLVFSHGMTIKCLLHYIMGFDQSFTWKLTLENTSISKLHFGMEGWRLLTINDYAHLL